MDAVRQMATLGAGTLLAAAALFGAASPAAAATGDAYGVTTGNKLIRFPVTNPGSEVLIGQVSGLQPNENILALDFRPAAPADLYAVTDQNRIYTLDESTAAATLKSTMNVTLNRQSDIGIDFNPSVDRLRIVTDLQQNLRVDVDTGTTTVDTPVQYASGDPNAGKAFTRVTGVAYTPSCRGGATTLYDIDHFGDVLSIQNPPNSGTLNTVGTLTNGSGGPVVNVTNLLGFDIDDTGQGFVAAQVNDGGQLTNQSRFYRINLGTGAMTSVGSITEEILRGIAIGIEPFSGCEEPVIPEAPVTALLVLGGAAVVGTAVVRARRAAA